MSKTLDGGIVTAYGAAKRGGYAGSYDDFCADLAQLAEVLQEFQNFSAEASTLSPESAATASYESGVLSLGIPQGVKGDTGNGIQSIALLSTSGLVKTYRVTYTSGDTFDFPVQDGNGITETVLNQDYTMTITYANGTTWTSGSIRGATGATPDISIGTVTTLPAGYSATAEMTGTAEAPVLSLGLPKGADGEVTAASMAPVFDATAAYSEGDYVWYAGQLYKFTADHAAGAWTGSDAQAAKVADDVADLTRHLSYVESETGLHITTDDFISGTYISANGTLVTDDRFSRTDMIHIPNGVTTIHIIDWKEVGVGLAYAFYSGADFTTNNFISGSTATGTCPVDLTIPQNAVYVAFSMRNSYMTFDATIDGSIKAYVDDQVAAVQSGIDDKIEAVDDRVTQIPEYVFEGFDLTQKDIPGHDAGVIALTGLPGYIARSDGQIYNTSSSWIHSDFIAIDDIAGNCGAFQGHGVVADVAYYSSDSFSTYLGYFFASGYDYVTVDTLKTNAPTGAKYVALSTDSNSKSLYATLSKKNPVTQITVKPDASKEYRLATGHAHISFDDCLFWIDLINNESTYTSAFQNSFLADVKEIHDEYGATFTLNTFNTNKTANTSATHDISNVPSKFAAELGACSSWLKFAFHGEDITVLYNTDDAAGILASYNKFKAAIFQMTGTVDSIDRVTRLSSFTGTLANVKAIRDTTAGISGLLATDQTGGANYYFASGSDANNMILNKGQYYDAENQIHFIKSQMRIEHGSFSTDVYNTLDYANYWAMIEFFAHEPQWSDNVKSKTKNLCAWLLNHGFDFTFAEHVYGI